MTNVISAPAHAPPFPRDAFVAALEGIDVGAGALQGVEAHTVVRGDGSRKPIGYEDFCAPSMQHLRRVLEIWKNTVKNNPTRLRLVRAIALIMAAGAKWPRETRELIHEWQADFEGNDPKEIDRICDSIHDTVGGYDILVAEARPHGFHDDAQRNLMTTECPPSS